MTFVSSLYRINRKTGDIQVQKPETKACEKLGGIPEKVGDVSYLLEQEIRKEENGQKKDPVNAG